MIRIMILALALSLFVSCRKELSDHCAPAQQRVEVSITDLLPDYLNSFQDLNIRSLTITLFSGTTGEVIARKINGSQGEFSIPYGIYSLFIYSSDFFELDGILYRGTTNSETYEAYSRQYVQNNTLFVEEPDPLFSIYIKEFVVDRSFEFLPVELQPLVFTYRFKIQVEGLEYINSASAMITGLYTSTFLSNGKHREQEIGAMKTGLDKTTFNGSDYLQGEFRSYGSHQSEEVKHRITVILTNGQNKVVELDDLTQTIKSLPHGGEIVISQKIVITPGGGGGGGNEYNPGVNPWDDLEISLPM